MAPTRSKKRKSTESTTSIDVQNFPAPPQMVPTKTRSPARTPTNRSPIKKQKMGITLAQKQALIDNLQLEITERARKLRAQYNLQAQGLRTRIEIRVNRIPMALRRAKMGDLHAKYSNTSRPATTASRAEKINSPRKNLIQAEQSHSRASPSPQRAPKRMSDDISVDKENEDIENPKKRVRGPPIPPARTTSRAKIQPSQVLSPRSANSRTLPRSPIRPASPAKSFLARPVSPLKPSAPVPSGGAAGILTNMVEKAKSTRAGAARKVTAEKPATIGAGRGKRTAPAASAPTVGRGRASTISESSESSNATIVRKPVPAPKKAPVKKSVMSTIKGMGSQKKMPAASKASAAPTAAGGRVLRKRN
ncbi:Borealin N terminal-domain-containing protein [Leptodontidium sp. 2 PMI_412]|nr:Borealin N terminal-domain-containing protein [Leptodontidium sp. MPI-SDFR-AT-0119]KAH9212064.1 Borealin N terminal-domain-containing protein [Leptodontidium sp. 2 PMI_412]